jgi:hypothetical protein
VLDLLSQSDACAEFPLTEFKKRMVGTCHRHLNGFSTSGRVLMREQAVLGAAIGSEREKVNRMQQLQVDACARRCVFAADDAAADAQVEVTH